MNSRTCIEKSYEVLSTESLQKKKLKLLNQTYHSEFSEINLILFNEQIFSFIKIKFHKVLYFINLAIAQKPTCYDALILQLES